MTPDELLDRAADEATRLGTCKGVDTTGIKVCMLNALRRTAESIDRSYFIWAEARGTLRDYLTALDPDTFSLISMWSDGHTHDERVEALRGAAKYYRAQTQSAVVS